MKKHSGRQIVAKLRAADVELGKGLTVPEVCKKIGVTEQTYCRWRQKYGGINAYVERFNGKLRDKLLDRELFLSLEEAGYVAERWRLDCNHHRPHSSLGWKTPAAFAAPRRRKRRPCVPWGSASPHPSEHTGKQENTLAAAGTENGGRSAGLVRL